MNEIAFIVFVNLFSNQFDTLKVFKNDLIIISTSYDCLACQKRVLQVFKKYQIPQSKRLMQLNILKPNESPENYVNEYNIMFEQSFCIDSASLICPTNPNLNQILRHTGKSYIIIPKYDKIDLLHTNKLLNNKSLIKRRKLMKLLN